MSREINHERAREIAERWKDYGTFREFGNVGETLHIIACAYLDLNEKLQLSEANFKACRDIIGSYGYEALIQERDSLRSALEAEKAKREKVEKHMGEIINGFQNVEEKLREKLTSSHSRERELREAANFAHMTLEHAIALDYVGEGSTRGMARDAIKKLAQALRATPSDERRNTSSEQVEAKCKALWESCSSYIPGASGFTDTHEQWCIKQFRRFYEDALDSGGGGE